MTRWIRAVFAQRCGRCNAMVAEGQPLCELRTAGVSRSLLRCTSCAGMDVDHAQLADYDHGVATMRARIAELSWKRVGELTPLDLKQRQTGERE